MAHWHCLCHILQVGIAIGMLALIDQRLSGIPWVYDGQLQQYVGREVRIQYCMFSAGTDYSIESRCSFAMAIAAVSLALSFVWSYLQVSPWALTGGMQRPAWGFEAVSPHKTNHVQVQYCAYADARI